MQPISPTYARSNRRRRYRCSWAAALHPRTFVRSLGSSTVSLSQVRSRWKATG